MPDNRETLALELQEAAREHPDETGSILLDLADHLGDTAGEFTDKALAEIAYAYLAGRGDAGYPHVADVRSATRVLMPLIPAVNRVR